MALLTGMTADGLEVPVQVLPDGKLVAEGLEGPAGPAGPTGPMGPANAISEFPAGNAAAPGLSVVNDPDTGIFSTGPNDLGISTSGIRRLQIEAGGNIVSSTNFRVDNTSNFQNFVFGSSGARVGLLSHDVASNWIYVVAELPNSQLLFGTANTEKARIDTSGKLLIGRKAALQGSQAILQISQTLNITTAVYADNTAARAGGLAAGDVYRKSDGTLMIAF